MDLDNGFFFYMKQNAITSVPSCKIYLFADIPPQPPPLQLNYSIWYLYLQIHVGKDLITWLFCCALVAWKITSATSGVRENLPVILHNEI